MQLFGTDDNALIIIRTTATLSSLLILLVANFALKIDPPAMGFLTEAKTFSMLEEIRTNPASLLYFALGWTALALTLLTYLVGCHLKMYQLYCKMLIYFANPTKKPPYSFYSLYMAFLYQ
jgi:hypothetical protein